MVWVCLLLVGGCVGGGTDLQGLSTFHHDVSRFENVRKRDVSRGFPDALCIRWECFLHALVRREARRVRVGSV